MKHLAFILLLLTGFAANASNSSDDNILTPPSKPNVAKPDDPITIPNAQLNQQPVNRLRLLAREGGWSGNGGDFNQVAHNIWFIGETDRPVYYCLNLADDYPLSKAQLRGLINKSIGDWLKFFEKYNLLGNKLAGGYKKPSNKNNLQFKDGINRQMLTKFIYKESCADTPLQFFFGIENKVLKEYKEFATDHPYGLAVRKSYDHIGFKNAGMIWVDNFSKEESEIAHVLLHELGHMFGMQHNSTYVMDEKIAELLTARARFKSSLLGKIESDSWKYGLLVNRPIILSSNKGRKLRDHQRAGLEDLCKDASFTPNKLLPRKVRRLFNLEANKCHQTTLIYKESAPLGGRLEGRRKRQFYLTIREEASPAHIQFVGRLGHTKGMAPKFHGPGVFTELISKDGGEDKYLFRKITLEKSPSIFPLSGSFSHGGVTYPAKVTSQRGPIVEIFVPQMGRWWTLKTSNNQY